MSDLLLTESMGFEPTVPCGTRLFESRTLNHSDNSPDLYILMDNRMKCNPKYFQNGERVLQCTSKKKFLCHRESQHVLMRSTELPGMKCRKQIGCEHKPCRCTK